MARHLRLVDPLPDVESPATPTAPSETTMAPVVPIHLGRARKRERSRVLHPSLAARLSKP